MRETVYLLPAETAGRIVTATLPPASHPSWQKRYSLKSRFIPPEHYDSWQEQVLHAAKEPVTAREIRQATEIPTDKLKLVLNRMAFEGTLLRVGANSLRSNIIRYAATATWAPEFRRLSAEEGPAREWLAGEYLRAFGPARVRDFQWWSGLTLSQARQAIAAHETLSLGDDYLLPARYERDFERHRAPAADQIDILPQWDTYLMGYAPDGRERLVSPDHQQHVYGDLGATGGNALGTVLLNGGVLGVWTSRLTGRKMSVMLTLFETPTSRVDSAITARFGEMAHLLDAPELLIDRR
jgi:hypothetical protein